MSKWVLLILLGAVIGIEVVHMVFHGDMEKDPHTFCQSRFPELRD